MRIKQNVAISESGYVFNPTTGESFTVNPAGIQIINYLKEGKSIEEITQLLLKTYEVEESMLEKDFQDFAGFLKSFGLMENNHG
ncbi:MAG: PqqD family protein [Bacteroidales bacterium]|nr:PqqD family protein [Bacteroidales bacterium]